MRAMQAPHLSRANRFARMNDGQSLVASLRLSNSSSVSEPLIRLQLRQHAFRFCQPKLLPRLVGMMWSTEKFRAVSTPWQYGHFATRSASCTSARSSGSP